ncbi:MAG: gliding motility-associated C-terminal domain-containing protein [Saprospiraceae bacterium]
MLLQLMLITVSDTAEIKLNEYLFDLSFEDLGVVCKDDTITFTLNNNLNTNLSYNWLGDNILSGGDTNTPVVAINNISEYSVEVTDNDYGCDTTLTFEIELSDIDVDIYADTLEVVITNSLTIEVLNVPDNSTINWSTGKTNTKSITITPDSTTDDIVKEVRTYCVTVTDEYGCSDEECIEITIINPACDESDIFIPNAFSPNGDGQNDIFIPRSFYITTIDMEIYDRWGELLYKASGDDTIHWDGTYKNKELPPDSYTYRIHVVCDDKENWTHSSNVSIIK